MLAIPDYASSGRDDRRQDRAAEEARPLQASAAEGQDRSGNFKVRHYLTAINIANRIGDRVLCL